MQIVVITPVLYAMGADNQCVVAALGGVQDASDLTDKEIAEAGYLGYWGVTITDKFCFVSLVVMSHLDQNCVDVLEKEQNHILDLLYESKNSIQKPLDEMERKNNCF